MTSSLRHWRRAVWMVYERESCVLKQQGGWLTSPRLLMNELHSVLTLGRLTRLVVDIFSLIHTPCATSVAAFKKLCRLIRLIWSPLLPFVYSIVSIRSIWICVRLWHRDYSEHDLSARSLDFERSDHSVVQIKDDGRKWLFHLPMKQQRVSSAGKEM